MTTAPLQEAAPRCPVAHGTDFDPLAPAEASDPMPWLRQAQRSAPVFYLPGYDLWVVTRYDDVVEVLRDTGTYSSRKTIDLSKLPPELLSAFPDGPPDRVLVSIDPPEHSRLRQLAQKAFTPKLIEEREDETRALCNALVDEFIDDKHCDLVSQFSAHLPVQVITRLVGAPLEKTEDFRQWASDRITLLGSAPSLSDEQRDEIAGRILAFRGWLREFVELRRVQPADDLASALVHAFSDDGSPVLSTSEVVNRHCCVGRALDAPESGRVGWFAVTGSWRVR